MSHAEPAARRSRKPFIIAGGALVLVGLYGGVAYAVSGNGAVPPRISVLGVQIGGLSREAAVDRLEASLSSLPAQSISLTVGDKPVAVAPADAGLKIDAGATVDRLIGFTLDPAVVFGRVFGASTADPVVRVDEKALARAVESIALDIDAPAQEPVVSYKKLTPTVTPGAAGSIVDRQAVAAALRSAFPATFVVRTPVPLKTVTPVVSDDAAAGIAKGDAVRAVAAPIQVAAAGSLGSGVGTLTPSEIAAALSWRASGDRLAPSFDEKALRAGISAEFAAIEQPGRSATFQIVDDKPVLVPSVTGIGVSGKDLAAAITPVLLSDQRNVSVTLGVIEPERSTAEIANLGIVERISSFRQKFPYAPYRKINIGKAAEYINGTFVMPGGVYSHNNTLGERTEENGYVKGFVIGRGGIFKEELGGGVSATATATWTAAFYAGMEPVQVRAHSIWISRYRPGLEATVSWGNFDMKFRNPAKTGVFITARATGTSITVEMWGTKQYDDIEAISGEKQDIRPFETISSTAEDCLEQDGQIGFKIAVDRVFYKDALEVKRETFNTTYRPSPHVLCPLKPSASPSATKRPTPSETVTPRPSRTATPRPTTTVAQPSTTP